MASSSKHHRRSLTVGLRDGISALDYTAEGDDYEDASVPPPPSTQVALAVDQCAPLDSLNCEPHNDDFITKISMTQETTHLGASSADLAELSGEVSHRKRRPSSVRFDAVRTRIFASGSKFASIITAWDALAVTPSSELLVEPFVEAVSSILIVVDAMGPAMQIIRADIAMQVDRVRTACTRLGAATLQRMVIIEQQKGKGTEALIWVKRTLQFVHIMMSSFVAGGTLANSVDAAYTATLHDAHPFIVRAIAKNIRFALPGDAAFVARLNPDRQLVFDGIGLFLRIMKPTLVNLVSFYNEKGIETVEKCKVLPVD